MNLPDRASSRYILLSGSYQQIFNSEYSLKFEIYTIEYDIHMIEVKPKSVWTFTLTLLVKVFLKFCHPRRQFWAKIEYMISPDHYGPKSAPRVKISEKKLSRLAPRQFFSQNFVTLVADFGP